MQLHVVLSTMALIQAAVALATSPIEAKQCGKDAGACPDGACCSASGTCGIDLEHCGFGCQVDYSHDSCHASEESSRVPYGQLIRTCNIPGVMALTFDDGPSAHTSWLLDYLASKGAKATFFVNGNNIAHDIDDESTGWPSVLRRMVREGHQLASHTWQHANLDTLDTAGRRGQMVENERALVNIFGFFPTYMRPPYGECGVACLEDMGELGYHVVNWNLDTQDWRHQEDIGGSMAVFEQAVAWTPGESGAGGCSTAAIRAKVACGLMWTSAAPGQSAASFASTTTAPNCVVRSASR